MKGVSKTLILINGWCGSGKDTLADFLVNNHNFTKVSFATSLKKMASKNYYFNEELCYTQEGKKKEIIINGGLRSIRSILIELAKKERAKDDCKFMKEALKEINETNNYKFVIPDFRYPEEYEFFKKSGEFKITTVLISRFSEIIVDDQSEKALKDFDFDHIIENTGSIGEYYDCITKLKLHEETN